MRFKKSNLPFIKKQDKGLDIFCYAKITFLLSKNKIIALGLAGLLSILPVAKKKAEAGIISNDIDVGVSAGVEYNFKNPISGFYDQLNQDFRDGEGGYIMPKLHPISNWKDIKAGSFIIPEVNGKLGIKIANGLKVEIEGGYKYGNSKTDYNEGYDVYYTPAKKIVNFNFQRTENYNVSAPIVGIGIKANLTDSTSASLKGNAEFVSVKGNTDYTMKRVDTNYSQWREANYEGKGTVFSVEAGLEQKIIDGLSVGISGGYKWGKVQTNGKEIKTNTSNKEVIESDYSPQFDFNNTYIKGGIEIKF